MKEREVMSERAQISVFIILGLAIAFVLLLLFFRGGDFVSFFKAQSPVEQIQKCVKGVVEEGIGIVSLQGGSVSPENYFLYDDSRVEYICYNEENYQKCVMQKPLLKQGVEGELEEYVKVSAVECVDSVVASLEGKGYGVSFKNPVVSVELIPNNVVVDLELDLQIVKEGTESYKSIKTDIDSRLYEFVIIASEIANNEAEFGDDEIMNYMMLDKWLRVEKKKQIDDTKIYILSEREGDDRFMFAVRSVALPAGVV